MAAKKEKQDALTELLTAASAELLRDLIHQLAVSRPDVRRKCLEYLKAQAPLSQEQKNNSAGEAALALWSELEPDLEELDSCGGEYSEVDYVGGLLYDLQKSLAAKDVEAEYRHSLLTEILPYIESGNAGLDDELYGVAFAACYENDDWRQLAEALERMKGDWKIRQAREIYRKLRDREKYLELRRLKMELGDDFHDLAAFYWETGEKQKAVAVAQEGLKKGRGRMDDLRAFLAERARESGNREEYLALQFAQATDHITLEKYKAFKEVCTPAEWATFEPKVLDRLNDAWDSDRLKIRMYRKEYEEALSVLVKGRYPVHDWDGGDELRAAKALEDRFPEEILKYYLSGLYNLKVNATRKEYARNAKVMTKIRHLLVDVLKADARWRDLAGKIKRDNVRRPAFQEEFAAVVAGWREL